MRPVPLFDLLTFTGDFPVYGTAAEQVANIQPDAVLLGEVISVSANPKDPGAPVSGALNSAWLTVRPHDLAGQVPPREDGLVVVEVYRPPLVTTEWLKQAYGYEGETLFVLRNVGDPLVATVNDSMGIYRTTPDGALGTAAVRDTRAPQDLRELSPVEASEGFEPLIR